MPLFPTAGDPNRNDFIDVLRAVAILGVFVFHALGIAYRYYELPWTAAGFRDFAVDTSFLVFLPASVGHLGVAIFFAVSGFCIHHSELKNGSGLKHYFFRRFFRIYPPYFAALVLFSLLSPRKAFGVDDFHFGNFLSHMFMVHNVNDDWFFGIDPPMWSLAVEVQLYALFPFLAWIADRIGWNRTLMITAAIEMIPRTVFAAMTVADPGLEIPRLVFLNTFVFWFSWTIGAWVADRVVNGRPSVYAIPTSPLLWLPAAALCWFYKPLSYFLFPLAAVWTAALIEKSYRNQSGALLRNGFPKAMIFIGMASYSMYLLHQPILKAWADLIKIIAPSAHPLPIFFAGLALLPVIIGLSWLSLVWLERPSAAYGKKLIDRSRVSAASAAG